MNICIYGGAQDDVREVYINSVYEFGRALARRGHTLVFGGGATGMMGAAAKGVREEGGHHIGVAPHFFHTPGILVEDWGELILTETMRQRKDRMEALSDAFVAVPGGIGTMDEFFEILTFRSLDLHGKPVALFNVDGYYDELAAFLNTAETENFTKADQWNYFGIFDDAESLLNFLEK